MEPYVTNNYVSTCSFDDQELDSNFDDYFNSFPPGYRFCPTEEELIVFYLLKKVRSEPLPRNQISEVDVYQHNPEIICNKYKNAGDREWYFFSPRQRKYPNGVRPKRSTQNGYWKASGSDKIIYSNGSMVGKWNTLVYYEGKSPTGIKTNWIMREYKLSVPSHQRTSNTDMKLDDFVLCKIYKKAEVNPNDKSQRNGKKIKVDEYSKKGQPTSNEYESLWLELAGDEPHYGNNAVSTTPFYHHMASINLPASFEHITQTYSLEDKESEDLIGQICFDNTQFASSYNFSYNTK